jgi:hypothetical protein
MIEVYLELLSIKNFSFDWKLNKRKRVTNLIKILFGKTFKVEAAVNENHNLN